MNGVAIKLEVNIEKAKIFQSIVKGSNFFTPIVDSYHTIGNHIIELSCSEKDNQHGLYNREVNGITFIGAESLWDSRELIMKAISEQNKLIKEEYDNSNK